MKLFRRASKAYPTTEADRQGIFHRTNAWIRHHPQRTYLIVGIVLILIALAVVAAIFAQPIKQQLVIPTSTSRKVQQTRYYSPLTGVQVADEDATKQPVTAVMIENSSDSRPQSGLKQAGIVYEAVAEAGITRFLALYQQDKPELIGPVRSVRMYYVDWAAPYNATIVHIGGSAAALAEVRNGNYRDGDQFFNSAYFWRASDRYAPHNVYTNFQKLDGLNSAKGWTESKFTGFARADGKPSTTPNATSVAIDISSSLYNTHYDYDAATNTYARSIAGEAAMDREQGRITPSVVIAMKVNMSTVMEDGYRESITTSGAGSAVVFQNGTATDCTWRKNSRTEPLQFVDANGKEIALNRGQTWIAAVPNNSGAVAWQ